MSRRSGSGSGVSFYRFATEMFRLCVAVRLLESSSLRFS